MQSVQQVKQFQKFNKVIKVIIKVPGEGTGTYMTDETTH